MREILFCGKRKDNGERVEGSLFFNPDLKCAQIIWFEYALTEDGKERYERCTRVDIETVSQYTGLTDQNNKRIFEGDIIKSCEYDDIYTVKYFGNDNYPAFDCVPEVSNCECNGLSYLVNVEGCEVIGNIYDNPELLKGATK